MTQTLPWHTFGGDKKNGGDSFLEVEDDSPKKIMETLTPKGVFIRFLTKFK